jgi:hypothetical protein
MASPVLAVSDVVTGLVFPLAILLVGGFLTGFLYPRVHAKRQREEKGIEIRTGLVTDMSDVAMTFLMTVQFQHLRPESVPQAEFSAAYKEWEVRSGVIGTRIEAYFPGTGLGERWTGFSERATRFYALAAQPEEARGEWGAVREELLNEKSALISAVLSARGMRV